jgi:hypothetical protein
MLVGYRTYIAAALLAIFSTLAVVDWNVFLSDPEAGWMGLVGALLMAVFRAITSTGGGTGSGGSGQ